MPEYKKVGYLTTDFKMFHLKDEEMRTFHYHYHDFHKILILLNGDVTYCIEGRSYDLKKNDIVLVHAGEVHKPVIHSDAVYDRIIMPLPKIWMPPSRILILHMNCIINFYF